MSKKSALRRELRERRAAASSELAGLLDSLESAYSVFNHTTDPALLEASILEITALQSRYGRALRSMKALNP